MTFSQIVNEIAEATNTSKRGTKDVLEAFASLAVAELRMGNKVRLPGLGNFRRHDRAPRLGRNPRTGETVQIPARSVIKFKAGKDAAL